MLVLMMLFYFKSSPLNVRPKFHHGWTPWHQLWCGKVLPSDLRCHFRNQINRDLSETFNRLEIKRIWYISTGTDFISRYSGCLPYATPSNSGNVAQWLATGYQDHYWMDFVVSTDSAPSMHCSLHAAHVLC